MQQKYNLYVVYFINCLINPNYGQWLKHQLKYVVDQLQENKMENMGNYKIYVVATIEKNKEKQFQRKLHRFLPNLDVQIEFFHENEFEYRGIKKVWELGQVHRHKNDIVLYYHSKGVSRYKSFSSNNNDKYKMYIVNTIVLKNIPKIFHLYTIHPDIDKIGYSCGGIGWIWHNFWYARGSYLCHVEKPIQTNRRHYYEDWLGRKVKKDVDIKSEKERPLSFYENTLLKCYSLGYTHPIGYSYDAVKDIYSKIA